MRKLVIIVTVLLASMNASALTMCNPEKGGDSPYPFSVILENEASEGMWLQIFGVNLVIHLERYQVDEEIGWYAMIFDTVMSRVGTGFFSLKNDSLVGFCEINKQRSSARFEARKNPRTNEIKIWFFLGDYCGRAIRITDGYLNGRDLISHSSY